MAGNDKGGSGTQRRKPGMTGPQPRRPAKGATGKRARTDTAPDSAVDDIAAKTTAAGPAPGSTGQKPARKAADDAVGVKARRTDQPSAGATPGDKPAAAQQDAAPGDKRDTAPDDTGQYPDSLATNMARIEELSIRLMQALARHHDTNPALSGPGPGFYVSAAQGWMRTLAENPARLIEAQTRFWGETLRHYAEAHAALIGGAQGLPPEGETTGKPADARFRNPLWVSNPWFSFLKRQYEINSAAMADAVDALEIDDPMTRRRIAWFTRQIIDMMAPTNFLATNPDALEKAVATEGASLVRGLENLVADIEASDGELAVSLVDKNAFTVGENVAISPGEVVFRAPLFELIQYRATTDQVHALPLLLIPPWINKFYILDLKPQNSMIKYLVDQGYTLFVVSWKNPDGQTMSDVGMDDYVSACLTATDQVLQRSGETKLNAVGYCIGGTALSLTLALMKQRGDERVNSATFFTTLTDFSDMGEFSIFLQDDFLGGIDDEVARTGVLGGSLMARTFNYLRANDLIWGPAVRNYMLGEAPPAFDLLYWNSDSTNLPGRMAKEYLRDMCVGNGFAKAGYPVLGETLRLSDLSLPMCSIACEGDHIAPWKDCWRGFSMTSAPDRTFILSQSGHIAGIVNPPTRLKYGHYTSDVGFGSTAEAWQEGGEFHEGSWWPTWMAWLAPRSGAMVPARHATTVIAPAPGQYVLEPAP